MQEISSFKDKKITHIEFLLHGVIFSRMIDTIKLADLNGRDEK